MRKHFFSHRGMMQVAMIFLLVYVPMVMKMQGRAFDSSRYALNMLMLFASGQRESAWRRILACYM